MEKKDLKPLVDNIKNKSLKAKDFVTDSALETASVVGEATKKVANKTRDLATEGITKVQDKIQEKRDEKTLARVQEIEAALEQIKDTVGEDLLTTLHDSPLELTARLMEQIKKVFPIPREQCILWADAEFDRRPSGIVLTNEGVFIKTDVEIMRKLKLPIFGKEQENVDEDTLETPEEAPNKSTLFYFRWDSFDPQWFTANTQEENKGLLVDPNHSGHFVEACRQLSHQDIADEDLQLFEMQGEPAQQGHFIDPTTPLAAAAVASSHKAVFVEQRAHVNNQAGHGEMAEEAITKLDRLIRLDAKVVGQSNTKDGPDRQIGESLFVQTKYYNSARGSLESSFSADNGLYRYYQDGRPMQLEVPKDQYSRVLKGFEKKIEAGKVPGVTDPKEALNYVREGRLTYKQAVNLTKPGTIESLVYDAATGAVICTSVFGITFVATVYMAWRDSKDLKQAVQAGASAGLRVFGISFLQHLLVSQMARTGLARTFMVPSQYVVDRLGPGVSAKIVNGLRSLSGQAPIHGAAASKHLAKILRSNALTASITFAAFSAPLTYNLVSNKVSKTQFAKNLSTLAGSMAGGAGGAVAAGIAAGKIAGAAGTGLAPGVGTAVGITGGFIGGVAVAKTVEAVGNLLYEDDFVILGRLFNAVVSSMVSEYLLDGNEIDSIIESLGSLDHKELKRLFESLHQADRQEEFLRVYLTPFFDTQTSERESFYLPEEAFMLDVMTAEFS